MKTFKMFVQEDYQTTLNVGGAVEVFVNPNSKEMRDIPSMPAVARGFLSGKRDVYLWDAEILHDDVKGKIDSSALWIARLEISFESKQIYVTPEISTNVAKKKIENSAWRQKYIPDFKIIIGTAD